MTLTAKSFRRQMRQARGLRLRRGGKHLTIPRKRGTTNANEKPMMQAILCMHPGERRPLKVFQVADGAQPLDCDGLARLGFAVNLTWPGGSPFQIIDTEQGKILRCFDDSGEDWKQGKIYLTPWLIRAELVNTQGDVVAIGCLQVMAVPVGWLPVPDLAVAPGPLLAEGADAPPETSRIVLANG